MDRLLGLCLVLAALGLGLLGALGYAVEPQPVALDRVATREGQRACVEATVTHARPTPSGGTRFLLEDADHSLAGRASFPWPALSGDLVAACGLVEREAGTLLLRIDRVDDVRVLRPWDAEATALAFVASEPWTYNEQHLVVYGVAVRDGARWFLQDPATGHRLRLSLKADPPTETPLRVEGPLLFDADENQFRLRAERMEPWLAP